MRSVCLLFLLAWGAEGRAEVHVARPDGPGIGSLVDASSSGDTLLLAPGVYRGPDNRDIRIAGKALVVIGQGPRGSVVIDCERRGRGFTLEGYGDSPTILEGLTIRGGNANDGGGIQVLGARVTLNRVTLVDNTAIVAGGGVHGVGGNVDFIDATITGNRAPSGGGLFFDAATLSLVSTDVTANLAVYGGGIYCAGIEGLISQCDLTGNIAWAGGAMCLSESSPKITRCRIAENESQTGGGGIRCLQLSSPEIDNTYFVNNRSMWNGGALHCRNRSSPRLVHCTFADNQAANEGAAIYLISRSCRPVLSHGLLSGDPPQTISGPGRARVESSALPYVSESATNQDSRGVSLLGADYHLLAGSPAIDAGSTAGVSVVDWDGDVRPWGRAADLGADEWVPETGIE